MKTSDIQIRDPFILPIKEGAEYYLFGSTEKNPWTGAATGFDCYVGSDLENWSGPIPAFRASPGFWATMNFWAPEVHEFDGRFYMFASFKSETRCRGTQILAADRPEGPFAPWSDGPVTPANWECLDGTLHIDESGSPWMVFCHEWTQIRDGEMTALRLSSDLRKALGEPVKLFKASDAPWVRGLKGTNPDDIHLLEGLRPEDGFFVTDGPFLYRTRGGTLLMLWSSFGDQGYAMGIARSKSGQVTGPWEQDAKPFVGNDGGHGMFFRSFDGNLFVTFHQPNDTPNERAVFHQCEESDESIRLMIPRRTD